MFVIGIFIAAMSAASWAMGTILFERIGAKMAAASLTFFKSLFSLCFMALLMTVFGWEIPSGRQLFLLALSGIVGISIGDTLFFDSLQCLGAKVQILYFIMGQVVTIFLSYLILGEVLTVVQYIGSIIILAGVLTVIVGKQDEHPNKLKGVIEGFLSMVCYSISIIVVKHVVDEVSAVTVTFYRMMFSAVFVLVGGFVGGHLREWAKPLRDTKLLALFLVNVVIVTYGGFLMSVLALKYLDVAIASIIATTEPVFGFVFVYLLYKDKPRVREVAGAVVALCGVFLMILCQ